MPRYIAIAPDGVPRSRSTVHDRGYTHGIVSRRVDQYGRQYWVFDGPCGSEAEALQLIERRRSWSPFPALVVPLIVEPNPECKIGRHKRRKNTAAELKAGVYGKQ